MRFSLIASYLKLVGTPCKYYKNFCAKNKQKIDSIIWNKIIIIVRKFKFFKSMEVSLVENDTFSANFSTLCYEVMTLAKKRQKMSFLIMDHHHLLGIEAKKLGTSH